MAVLRDKTYRPFLAARGTSFNRGRGAFHLEHNIDELSSAVLELPLDMRANLRKRSQRIIKEKFVKPLRSTNIIPKSRPRRVVKNQPGWPMRAIRTGVTVEPWARGGYRWVKGKHLRYDVLGYGMGSRAGTKASRGDADRYNVGRVIFGSRSKKRKLAPNHHANFLVGKGQHLVGYDFRLIALRRFGSQTSDALITVVTETVDEALADKRIQKIAGQKRFKRGVNYRLSRKELGR